MGWLFRYRTATLVTMASLSGSSHTRICGERRGFEHLYAHLSKVETGYGRFVGKGDRIGRSGETGGVDAPLHVHLKPFNAEGEVPLAYPPRK